MKPSLCVEFLTAKGVFPVNSPRISKIEIETEGKARRAKLNYLRRRKGKEATTVRE
jgi:large subunit ribosomal protein L19